MTDYEEETGLFMVIDSKRRGRSAVVWLHIVMWIAAYVLGYKTAVYEMTGGDNAQEEDSQRAACVSGGETSTVTRDK